MQDGQIKLRIRLQQSLRRTRSQHRNLREIYAELDRALDSREEREVGFWIERLCDALLAHFALEQKVLFPTLVQLIPSARPIVAELKAEHIVFIENLRRRTARSQLEDAVRALSEVRDRLDAHEAAEEELITQALESSG
jgi:hemerythrin